MVAISPAYLGNTFILMSCSPKQTINDSTAGTESDFFQSNEAMPCGNTPGPVPPVVVCLPFYS